MASPLHDTLAELFRHRPQLAAELLVEVLGVALPAFTDARAGVVEVVERSPVEHRADVVVVLRDGVTAVLSVVVEVQLRPDPQKWWTWPHYVTSVRLREGCPTILLVVCSDRGTARWASRPIALGNVGAELPPAVLGPDQIPVVSDVAVATRLPELAVLSALAHGNDPEHTEVLEALAEGLANVDVEHAVDYTHLVLITLSALARARLEIILSAETFEYQTETLRRRDRQARDGGRSEGRAEGLAEGRAEGRAAVLLRILAARGVEVPPDARAVIEGSTDLSRFDDWVDRSLVVASVDELLAE